MTSEILLTYFAPLLIFDLKVSGFDHRMSPEVKSISTIRKFIYDFLTSIDTLSLSRTDFEIFDIKVFRLVVDL